MIKLPFHNNSIISIWLFSY